MNVCFGLASVFAMDSKTCKECKQQKDCAVAVFKELEKFSHSLDLKAAINRHKKFMEANKLLVKETFYVPEPVEKPQNGTDAVAEFGEWLKQQSLVGEGVIAEDKVLEENTPAFFFETVKYLRLAEKATPEQVVNNIKYKMSEAEKAKVDPTQLASLSVQILHDNKIIQVTDKYIRWLL